MPVNVGKFRVVLYTTHRGVYKIIVKDLKKNMQLIMMDKWPLAVTKKVPFEERVYMDYVPEGELSTQAYKMLMISGHRGITKDAFVFLGQARNQERRGDR